MALPTAPPRGPSPPVAPGGGKPPGRPPREGRRDWWRDLPPPFNRPRPINRRNVFRAGLIAVPFLALVDGALGVAAWYATGNWIAGAGVGAALFIFTVGEVALVAWAAHQRQELERRRARER